MHKYSEIDLYYFLNIICIIKKCESNCATFSVNKLFTINYAYSILYMCIQFIIENYPFVVAS